MGGGYNKGHYSILQRSNERTSLPESLASVPASVNNRALINNPKNISGIYSYLSPSRIRNSFPGGGMPFWIFDSSGGGNNISRFGVNQRESQSRLLAHSSRRATISGRQTDRLSSHRGIIISSSRSRRGEPGGKEGGEEERSRSHCPTV